MTTAPNNTRHATPVTVSSNATPNSDVCKCGHDASHHGGTGPCRFGTTHGCTVFTPAETN